MLSANDFQRLKNALTTNLSKITTNTKELEDLVKKIGTTDDSEPLRDRYLRLQNDTKSLMEQMNADIKKVSEASVGADEQRSKKTLLDTISKQYPSVCKRFIEAQRTGARKEKESLERAKSVLYQNPGVSNPQFQDEHGYSATNTGSYQQQQQQVVLPMEQNVDMQSLQERDDQIRQLESNIVQVSELFKDVHNLVHEHGEIIDSIGDNIDDTDQRVVAANVELKNAVKYQTAARRKKIMLIAILIIVIVIVVLVIGIYFGVNRSK